MKLDYIDALRGIAILSVIWFHCHLHNYSDPAFYSLMDMLGSPAALGVQLFYVLSAFTLFLSQYHRQTTDNSKFNFFIRRFFRIAPMYYAAMVYYLYQDAHFYKHPISATLSYNVYGIIANSLLVHGLSPVWINSIIPGGWSVGIEVLFYAMVPFLFTRIANLNKAILFTASATLVGFLLTTVLSQFTTSPSDTLLKEYLFYYLPYQLPAFGCGIIAYFVVIRKDRQVSTPVVLFAIGVYALLLVSKTIGRSLIPNQPHVLHLFASIGFALLIIGLSRWRMKLLINRATLFMGKISYSAYLTHFGVLYWLDRVLPEKVIPVHSLATNILNFHLKFLIAVLATALVSAITYRLIETPAQQYGRRFIRKPQKSRMALVTETA